MRLSQIQKNPSCAITREIIFKKKKRNCPFESVCINQNCEYFIYYSEKVLMKIPWTLFVNYFPNPEFYFKKEKKGE